MSSIYQKMPKVRASKAKSSADNDKAGDRMVDKKCAPKKVTKKRLVKKSVAEKKVEHAKKVQAELEKVPMSDLERRIHSLNERTFAEKSYKKLLGSAKLTT